MIYIIAQIVGFIAFFASIIAYHKDKKKKILNCMAISNVLNLIHYLLLQAYSGCITKVIAIIRYIVVINKDKNKILSSKFILIAFVLVYIVVAIFSYTNIWSIFPVMAAVSYTIAIWVGNEKTIKEVGLEGYFLWLIYNISILSISGSISNVICIISTSIAVYNENRRGNK